MGTQKTFGLFQPLQAEEGEMRIEYMEYRPVGQISNKSVIEFDVPTRGNRYIDLRRSRFLVEIRILKADGTVIDEESNVALINQAHAAIFRQCEVLLQQVPINPDIGLNYAYKAYIDTQLMYSEDAKEAHLQSEFVFHDTAAAFNSPDPADKANVGLYTRYLFTKGGQAVLLSGPLHSDVFSIDRYLINGVPLDIKLYPGHDSFALMSPNNGYQVQILDAKLKMCQVHVSNEILEQHGKCLEYGPALYPMNKSEIKVCSIPAGMTSYRMNDMFQGRVPSRVIVGLTPSKGYNGSYQDNPFYFPHMDVNYMAFYVDGVSRPDQPFTPDFANNKYVESFLSLSRGVGNDRKNTGNYIDIREYPKAYALHVFDVHGTRHDNIYAQPSKGQTMLEIRFAKPLPEPTVAIIYATFSACIEVDKARNIVVKL